MTTQAPFRWLAFVTGVAALGGFLFGYDTAVIAGAVGALREHFQLTAAEQGHSRHDALPVRVGVRLHEPRDDDPPAQVDHRGVGSGQRQDLRVGADRQDALVGVADRRRPAPGRVGRT